MKARISQIGYCALVFAFVAAPAVRAATFTGTVTNKTINKPSAGDSVALVDVQAGMSEAARVATNIAGQYSISAPGVGPYLLRVNHQGATYFIAAPQNSVPGDITVYDVAAKVEGVGIDADMILVEAAGGMLRVKERYLVRNTSLPPKAQFSNNTFEIEIPDGAELDGASATRPGGLGTNTHLAPLPQKRHYTFNVPIQPDQGEKETLFEVQYHISYNGKYTFSLHPQMQADSVVVYTARGISFAGAPGVSFRLTQEDPRVETHVTKNVRPGQSVDFTVSGEGQMQADSRGASMDQQGADTGAATVRPGGGIGNPIGTPDPLTSYKWWILAAFALLLTTAAILLLRRRTESIEGATQIANPMPLELDTINPPSSSIPVSQLAKAVYPSSHTLLLNSLKEELFAIETEKLSGRLSLSEYAQVKVGLEAVLKRALDR
jgi:hypothetical protein